MTLSFSVKAPSDEARVYVALADENEPAMAASLAAAQDVALSVRASLTGVWLEDAELATLAQLPFARQVLHRGPSRAPLDPAQLERYLQTRADRARAAFERLSGSSSPDFYRLRCNHTITGIFATLDTNDSPAFLVHAPILPNSNAKVAVRKNKRESAKPPANAERNAMASASPDLAVLYDGTPTSERAFGLAIDLTTVHERARLMVLLVPELSFEHEQNARALIAGHPQVLFVRLSALSAGRGALRRDLAVPPSLRAGSQIREILSRALQGLEVAALLVPATYAGIAQHSLPDLAKACRRAVIVIR